MNDQQPPLEPYQPAGGIDPAVRAAAVKRIEERQAFVAHLASYVIVNTALVVIWLVTGAGVFWPMWPMLGWGIGIAFHALSLRDQGITEEQIAAEAAKLQARRQQPPLQGPQDEM